MSYDQYRGREGMGQFKKPYGCGFSTSKVQKGSFFTPKQWVSPTFSIERKGP